MVEIMLSALVGVLTGYIIEAYFSKKSSTEIKNLNQELTKQNEDLKSLLTSTLESIEKTSPNHAVNLKEAFRELVGEEIFKKYYKNTCPKCKSPTDVIVESRKEIVTCTSCGWRDDR